MKPGLHIGHTAELVTRVGPQSAIHLGANSRNGAVVFSTPSMIGLMEHAARRAIEPFLEPSEESVGVTVSVEHVAATPLAAEVRAIARVTSVEDRKIGFDVTALDSLG